ncbi:ABC transporter ATP-binding protein [Pelagibacterium sp. H642]|uniref:ABC transporter ATP-binding protein n=1 Tax=Pelagibacterium sp. H642 TaxID=1881069 RepID=UPI00281567A1|nr:ABC transporter ATP-binding protein [Pelagibacterium sp. H642]WMT91727.1 ABC transporter ATP-binding protein [Pelagibacterium sp. H642]
MVAIDISGVEYRYGDHKAVDGISLTVEKGEFFALLGPNGAGKTTLLNMLMTVTHPSAGHITIAGQNAVTETAQVRRSLGVVFQDPALDDRLTAAENLQIHTVLYALPRSGRADAVAQALQWASLEAARGKPVRSFSGGMKRRLELARALMHEPQILLLDEPTIGLDPQGRRHLWERIASLRQRGMTVLMTTHNLAEAELCDRVGIIDQGKLVAVGVPRDLIEAHGGGPGATLEDVFIALTGKQLFDESATGRDLMVGFAKRGGEHTR